MKKLILTTLLVSTSLYAGPEVMDGTEGKQVATIIQDLKVKDMLEKTSEFSKCRAMNEFKASDDETARNKKVADAEKCFQEQLRSKNANAEELGKLSDKLNLQSYGLVQSNNLKQIQSYLSDKMYESMTGVSRKENDTKKLLENLRFGKKKNLDQKTFVEMYKTQVGKNALYEVSRFCFEKFRMEKGDRQKTNFADYWSSYQSGSLKIGDVNDLGDPQFGADFSGDDKKKVYQDIFTSIQGANNQGMEDKMSDFFMECGKLIPQLCTNFKKNLQVDEANTKSKTDEGLSSTPATSTPGTAATTPQATVKPGAAACLAQARIQEYKAALKKVADLDDYFDKQMNSSPTSMSLVLQSIKKGEPIKTFGDGKDANEESIDDLTNHVSSDFLDVNAKDDALNDKLKKCQDNPEFANCEGVISQGDSLEKAKHDIDMELTIKRDVEMARVRKLKEANDATLDNYLKENGFFDLLQDPNFKSWDAEELAKRVGQSYEAKKVAVLQEINKKLSSRQVKTDVKTISKPQADEVAKQTKEERARLAQVVLFNNIITSRLKLQKKDGSGNLTSAGVNVNVWTKEKAGLQGKVDAQYFANVQKNADEQGIGKDSQIAGFDILDELLGKENTDTQKSH